MSEQSHTEDPECPECQRAMGPTTAGDGLAKPVLQPSGFNSGSTQGGEAMALSFRGVAGIHCSRKF